jgi:uncharacterized protein
MHPQHQHELKQGLLRGLLWIAIAGGLLLVVNLAFAAKPADRSSMLFPYYNAEDVLSSTVKHHYAKDTAKLLTQLKQLDSSSTKYCEGGLQREALKAQYSQTYLAWLELSAVVMGPMLLNNTVRQIDFRPLRVNLLERAIKKQPQGAQAMALVGSPAKGFPALEYLLEQTAFKAGAPECNYAQEVVRDMIRTVSDLNWQGVDQADMQLYFNQLVGATHNLAWERMEKPLLKNRDELAAGGTVDWPFSALGLTEKTWAAQWQGLADLLVVNTQTVPDPAQQVVPLEAYLRGLGKIDLADTLLLHANAVAAALKANDISKPASVEQSVKAAKALKGFLETEVAKGLNVSIQFSSSDGD